MQIFIQYNTSNKSISNYFTTFDYKKYTMLFNMKNRSLVSIDDFTTDEILKILDLAEEFQKTPPQPFLSGKVIASLFFEIGRASCRERV